MASDIKLADGKGLIRGDDYTLNVTFTGVDLTGATVYFTVNESSDPSSDASAAFQKINGPTEHLDAAAGKTNFSINGAVDTADLEGGVYNYDMQVVTSTGAVTSTRRGKFLLDTDITRSA